MWRPCLSPPDGLVTRSVCTTPAPRDSLAVGTIGPQRRVAHCQSRHELGRRSGDANHDQVRFWRKLPAASHWVSYPKKQKFPSKFPNKFPHNLAPIWPRMGIGQMYDREVGGAGGIKNWRTQSVVCRSHL